MLKWLSGLIFFVAIAIFAAYANTASTPVIGVGAAPQVWEAYSDGLRLIWVASEKDCLSCTAPTYVLRRVNQAYGDDVPLTVTPVGAEDPNFFQAYLAHQRIVADIQPLSWGTYRAYFGHSAIPALYLLDHGVIARIWAADENPRFLELDSLLTSRLGSRGDH